MAFLRAESSTVDEPQPPDVTPTSSTMKLPQILRRGSAVDTHDLLMERDTRSGSMPEPTRKSSLSTLPLRLRRRKTQTTNGQTEENTEAAYASTRQFSSNSSLISQSSSDRLGRLFFALPSEIVTQIVTHLTLRDVYALRQVSHSFNAILNYNATFIIRSCLHDTLPSSTTTHIQTRLYPTPTPTHDLTHLLTTLRRQHLIDRQIYNLLAFVQMKIYMTRTATRVLSVSDNRQRLIEAFQRPAWFVTHFLEQYRSILLHQHPSHNTTTPNCSSCHLCRSAARAVVASYPLADIMPTYHFAQLTLEHLQVATRSPTAANSLERRLRGWSKVPVTEENLAIFVVLGGIPEIGKVAMMQGSYNSRIAFVADFVEKVREAVAVTSILKDKTKMGRVSTASSGRSASRSAGDEVGLEHLAASLSAPFSILTQEHITSLPDVSRLFYDIWKERIQEIGPETVDIYEPYPWLQRVMSGTGLEFGQSRTPEPPLLLGASPV